MTEDDLRRVVDLGIDESGTDQTVTVESVNGLLDAIAAVAKREGLLLSSDDCVHDPAIPWDVCAAHGSRCPFWGETS